MPKITLSATSVKASPSRRRRCQTVYRVRNGAAYDAGLKQRGRLTLWLSPQAIQAWYDQGPTRRGSSYTYSALAIRTALMMRLLFHLLVRQTEGFLSLILEWMGVDLAVPDHTTLSRRHAGLKVALPVQPRHEPMHLVVDSTGLKVAGEGESKKGLKPKGKGTNVTLRVFMQQSRWILKKNEIPNYLSACRS